MIELLDVFGNDLTVVNAARVSFAKESTQMSLGDEKLITYLAKHNHVSPFFHPQIRIRAKMPIFVAREWYRHQIGFARNEVSRRYVSDTPECWVPTVDHMRERDPKLKQGSKSTTVENSADLVTYIQTHVDGSISLYEHLLEQGVAPEVARCVLPQSMMTEFIETGSLAAYARLYSLRNSPDAQREIRDYAQQIGEAIEKHFPISWKALTSGQVKEPVLPSCPKQETQ
jgi:thymidylate synthase (FAD)